jgi:hypothetical protein
MKKVAISLARIEPKIFQAICEKSRQEDPKLTDRAIYLRIETVKEEFGNAISIRMAANVLASRMKINVHGVLKDDEDELRELRELLRAAPSMTLAAPAKERKNEREQVISIGKKIIDTFGLPQNLANEADRMSEIYPHLYFFENLMRYVVASLLEKKHGKDWWTEPEVVPNQITKKVEDRKNKEGENRWHSERGSQAIFYTDFGDLSSIISKNWEEFKTLFPNLRWIQTRLEETELSRNIIAHNNPLPKKECDRLKMFLDDLKKQLGICVEEKP